MFLDTYALLALLEGSPAYAPYRQGSRITHPMNILEALVVLYRKGEPEPRRRLDALGVDLVPATDLDLEVAARLRTARDVRGRGLSLVDCLGYAVSRRTGRPFLTGDRGFLGLPRVELVRA
ncbi:MAG TPA: type II toxin-antitoxin system VapC family toxin [Candidatus Thermoplasmatota archaeon]|nr:type II toxin-antitoxin system VapC family toxin [Candidatus Thermoplasmatota archaeon]